MEALATDRDSLADPSFTNLHLLRVELRCKLPGKLHHVTGPLAHDVVLNHAFELLINTTMLF